MFNTTINYFKIYCYGDSKLQAPLFNVHLRLHSVYSYNDGRLRVKLTLLSEFYDKRTSNYFIIIHTVFTIYEYNILVLFKYVFI